MRLHPSLLDQEQPSLLQGLFKFPRNLAFSRRAGVFPSKHVIKMRGADRLNLLTQRPVAGDLNREWRTAHQLLLERQGCGDVIADMERAIAKAFDEAQPPHVLEPANVRLHDPAVRIGLEAGMGCNRVDPAGLVGDPCDRNVGWTERRLIGFERHH